MAQKGFSAADAVKNGFVPAAPIARVIEKWAAEHYWLDDVARDIDGERMVGEGSTRILAEAVDIHPDTIGKIRGAKKEWVEFDAADRIVTFVDPFLWHSDPELAAIYQSYDFSWLDLARPTSDAANPLPMLDCLSDRLAGAVLGVSQATISRHRHRIRREAAVAV